MTARIRRWPPIPLRPEEREALLGLAYLVRRGLLGPPDPALYARLTARLAEGAGAP